jgi:anaphase-promoting complex subunit 4
VLLVYIYRVVSDSENGVSSTREICLGALDLQEGEIRQIQFVQDDTMMLLWSNNGMLSTSHAYFAPKSLTTLE